MTICTNCPDYTCAYPIPECSLTLNLGDIDAYNSTSVDIFIEKQNGAIAKVDAQTDGVGNCILDLTDPSADFYNSHDGLYLIWVCMPGTYKSEQDKLPMTIGGVTATTWGVSFDKVIGMAGGHVEIEPV